MKKNEVGKTCGTDGMGEESNVCRVLVVKPGGKTPLRWLRHR
jgi:hypothetical protein